MSVNDQVLLSWGDDSFLGAWGTLESKGLDPFQSLASVITDGLYSIAITPYGGLGDMAYAPGKQPYKTREQAWAAVGRALDKRDKLESCE